MSLEFEKTQQQLLRTYRKSLKRILKSREKAIADLQRCRDWENTHHLGELLQANLYKIKKGTASISVEDWLQENKIVKISLEPLVSPADQVSQLFRQARKLKAGIPHMERQVERMQVEVMKAEDVIRQIEEAETEEALELFKPVVKPKKTAEELVVKRYREYLTESGLLIWVGKSARDNDLLTFRLANGSDWWFHVSDFPGSHVILKVRKNEEPDREAIKDAMLVALHHSKAKDRGEAEVCVTQCKYVVKSGRHKAGQVQVSKHKNIKIINDKDRFNALKSRKVTG